MLGRQGRAGAAQRHPGLDRAGAGTGCSRRATCSPRPWSPARCRSTPPRAATRRSTRASTTLRGQPGQIDVAAALPRAARRAAPSAHSHRDGDDRVQDPYSLRCQPQVMGACLDMLAQRRRARCAIEANAVSDNPLVFADTGEVLSGGNFHAEPVAFAADTSGAGHRRDRRAGRAAHRAADRRHALAACRRSWCDDGGRQLRLHDRPRHRRGAGVGEQDAGAPGQRRLACRPRPTRRTTSAWPPSRRAGWATWRTTRPPSSPSSCWPRRRASNSTARCAPRRALEHAHAQLRAQGAVLRPRPLLRARHRGREADGR